MADAAKLLQAEEHETLVRMLLEWAKDDARLHEKVLLYTACRSDPETAVAAAGRAFEDAVAVHGFVHYREAWGWAQDVNDAVSSFEQLLNAGQAPAAIELCESALQTLVRAVESVNDSDGHLGTLRDRLQDIHFRACKDATPDPIALAKRLFQWELGGGLDAFRGAVIRYSEILGAQGMKAYRQLAEEKWNTVPTRDAKSPESGWSEHFEITHIMESLAEASGDVDELVGVMSRDLSHPYTYLRIAEVCRKADRHEEALLWAEKGLKAFPERTDRRLREFASEEYHRRGRHNDAMDLMWAEFSERPYLGTYQELERHAEKAGSWREWRTRALHEFRIRSTKDHSALVEVFLYEGDVDTAWREAQEGGCSDNLWLRLAANREKDHPADAAPIYMMQAEAAIAGARNSRYDDSVSLLVKAAAVMKRMDRRDEFERELQALRQKYKIKRNFVKLLGQKHQSLYL